MPQKLWQKGVLRLNGWERILFQPELVLPDAEDSAVERYFRTIPEFEGRVVSMFFDRTMKGEL